MRTFGEVATKELLAFEGGEFFVHFSPRSFKKGIVSEFIPSGNGVYRVTTTGFDEPHSTEPFGTWQPTEDKCRYVEIGVDFLVLDMPPGMMLVADEKKGVLYEFLPKNRQL